MQWYESREYYENVSRWVSDSSKVKLIYEETWYDLMYESAVLINKIIFQDKCKLNWSNGMWYFNAHTLTLTNATFFRIAFFKLMYQLYLTFVKMKIISI